MPTASLVATDYTTVTEASGIFSSARAEGRALQAQRHTTAAERSSCTEETAYV